MTAEPPTVAHRQIRVLVLCVAILVAALVAMSVIIASSLHEDAFANAELNLRRQSLTLAGQADRSFQSVDLILSNIADRLENRGVIDSTTYAAATSNYDTFEFLQSKLVALPQLEAITMIDAQGKLLNFSRFWPIPDVNVADRDYFKALHDDPKLVTFISAPVKNRGTGTWNIYLARRVNGQHGEFAGLILAAMSLQYFEDFYKSITLGDGATLALLRDDGTSLARYPHVDIGANLRLASSNPLYQSNGGVVREVGAVDHILRVKASHRLANLPLLIVSTLSEDSVLREWYKTMKLLIGLTSGVILMLVIAAITIARQWRQQEQLAVIKAEKAEAEKAKAEAETELLREKERAADTASRTKSSFLAMMSHEIRTPMNSVLGLASTLLETRLDADQRKSVKAIHESGDHLLEILNDILDFSKMETGAFALESVPFAPDAIVDGALALIADKAEGKGLSLRVVVDPALPPVLLGDAGRIRQVLLNLLSNAIKFTARGEIVVKVDMVQRRDDSATVGWSVRDTGMGIAPDRIGTLFQDFVQVDSSISRRFGGSGLGLAICRRIIEQMGGQMDVASQPGVGSTFHFQLTLPLSDRAPDEVVDDKSTATLLNERIRALGHPLRLLITDDNATNRMVAVKMFGGFDVEITEAGNGVEAIEAVERASFDLILMDMQMPEMDGMTATMAIRARGGRHATVPIIAFTANAFAEDREACVAAGMTDFIAKPVRKALLLQATLRAIAGRPQGAMTRPDTMPASEPSQATGTPDVVQLPEFEPEAFKVLADELDLEDAMDAFQVFLADAKALLLALSRSDAASDRTALKMNAHTLKAISATFGFRRFSELARQLEQQAAGIGDAEFDAMVHGLTLAFEAGKDQFNDTFEHPGQRAG